MENRRVFKYIIRKTNKQTKKQIIFSLINNKIIIKIKAIIITTQTKKFFF